jgi:hypothetical protein
MIKLSSDYRAVKREKWNTVPKTLYKMEHLSSPMEQHHQDQQVQWRRDKVQGYWLPG